MFHSFDCERLMIKMSCDCICYIEKIYLIISRPNLDNINIYRSCENNFCDSRIETFNGISVTRLENGRDVFDLKIRECFCDSRGRSICVIRN